MAKLSYFRRIVTPAFNLVMNKFKKQNTFSDYIKIASAALIPGKLVVPNLVLVMTTKCSLKCAECNNLMPYYENPYDRPVEEIIADLDGILKNIDGVVDLSLIGGEPFLYPDLVKVLEYVKSSDKIMFANLTSNGTIMPKEEVFAALRHKKLMVLFSDYGVGTQKIDDIKKAFSDHGIEYGYKRDLTWVTAGSTSKRGKTMEQLRKEYVACFSSRYCKTILNGRIYACSRSAHLHDLGYMEDKADYFEIHKEGRSRGAFVKELLDFLLRDYCMACDYCDHYKQEKVKPGVQAKGVLH